MAPSQGHLGPPLPPSKSQTTKQKATIQHPTNRLWYVLVGGHLTFLEANLHVSKKLPEGWQQGFYSYSVCNE